MTIARMAPNFKCQIGFHNRTIRRSFNHLSRAPGMSGAPPFTWLVASPSSATSPAWPLATRSLRAFASATHAMYVEEVIQSSVIEKSDEVGVLDKETKFAA